MLLTSAVCFAVAVVAASPTLPHRFTTNEGLDNPARLAVTQDRLYVADTRANKVVVFDLGGNPLSQWAEPAGPVGVAADNISIYVSRRDDGKVAAYDLAHVFQRFIGQGVVTFTQPTDLALDPTTGRLYVVDSGADRIYAFNADGSLALMLGGRGGGFGQFRYPSAIAIDAPRDRILVADQDNYRVQVFSRSGIFLFKFGYRIRFLPNGDTEGWFARTSGLSVDGSGRIYVADALMSTLRVFSTSGSEIGKVVSYGMSPGQLQTPGGVAIGTTGSVYLANSGAGTVEVYDPLMGANVASAEPVGDTGFNRSIYDLLGAPYTRQAKAVKQALWRIMPDSLATAAASWDPPHMLADTTCGRCHDVDGQPGTHLATMTGQFVLCTSCHTGAGHAFESSLRMADRESITGPAPNSEGRSHAWDVPAINDAAGSLGPPAQSEMAHYLSEGRIKCATCHNQHSHQAGTPYLRTSNEDGNLCKQCHTEHIGHTPSGSWQPTCVECHQMHNPASANLSLVATQVYSENLGVSRAVVLTSRTGPNSFDDGNPVQNDGLCQVCHTATAYHRHDGTGVAHNDGQDCISCHPHKNGFLPAGGDCLSCHAGPKDNGDGIPVGGRRGVVGEFPLSDAHAHYGAQLDSAACVVCHDQATHMDGYVDLNDPDGGPSFRFVRITDLQNDPDVSDFCAHCHDANGATRLAAPLNPFGNGNPAPDVAQRFAGTLQWDEQYGDFCFGNEGMLRRVNSHHDISSADQAVSGAKLECLNCHGAHAAGASQPLVDPFVPQVAWAAGNNEFCLACHGGGTGPLDPGFPPTVQGPIVNVDDPRWAGMGFDWNVILGGACLSSDCSSLRGIDSCDYVEGPWYVDYSWTHSAHGLDSKRGWNGYSGAPGAALDCMACHDAHGSVTASNPAGNPYMIRDVVDGTTLVDDGARTLGFNGPPFTTFGVSRPVVVAASGLTVDWGSDSGLCEACHASWLEAYDFHGFCTSCQTCHGHGMAWNEADWVDFNSDTACPVPAVEPLDIRSRLSIPSANPTDSSRLDPPLHQLAIPKDSK